MRKRSAGKENQRLAVAGIFFAALFSFLFVSGTFASLTFTGMAITGDASSTIDVGSGNTLLLQTTNNGPVQAGTGLFTILGNLSVASGTTLVNVTSTGSIFGNTVLASTSLSIGGGATISRHLSATSSLGFGDVAMQACRTQSVSVTGAASGDTVVATPSAEFDERRVVWSAYVSSTDTVVIFVCNPTASSKSPATSTWRVDVWKH